MGIGTREPQRASNEKSAGIAKNAIGQQANARATSGLELAIKTAAALASSEQMHAVMHCSQMSWEVPKVAMASDA
jgi:hypothetical protein